ncbi:uncharacterized protein LACBIDRAFT_331060 [Laccaria bicolor S238N-H82]|uniref:Predicted protein n=1 Tax=Laccaria bicolor (strain S238N-H82 / ATCC MYA-4686) TaxID=486041 RepID=B0DNB2_LACBS|nr:uncharacterized protein LACBIDRAFT_331060 [Laccaria bicolor S238N-H82]EDR03911.1 predicted protein [Laccaria bicolor S238N-H82]|eukprot:XP_001885479.1 predicted protein [Laccaria bicolor S238N-H82]
MDTPANTYRCGRSFYQTNNFNNHLRSYEVVKSRVSRGLTKAKELWEARKKQRNQKAAAEDRDWAPLHDGLQTSLGMAESSRNSALHVVGHDAAVSEAEGVASSSDLPIALRKGIRKDIPQPARYRDILPCPPPPCRPKTLENPWTTVFCWGQEPDKASLLNRQKLFWPYTSFLLGDWYWNDGTQKTQTGFQNLVRIIADPEFVPADVLRNKWDRINAADAADEGWTVLQIKITVPFHAGSTHPGPKVYEGVHLYHRSLVMVMKERVSDPHYFCHFHVEPYRLLWQQLAGIVNAIQIGTATPDYAPQRFDFLWVRWFSKVTAGSWKKHRLECISFPPMANDCSFGFLDPNDVVRACHIVPAFSSGARHPGSQGLSLCARDSADFCQYYVGRFVDRDMLMRYHVGLGIGHVGVGNILHSHVAGNNDAAELSSGDLQGNIMDIDPQHQEIVFRRSKSRDNLSGQELFDQPLHDHNESSTEDDDDLDESGSEDHDDTPQAEDSDPGSESLGSESEYDD